VSYSEYFTFQGYNQIVKLHWLPFLAGIVFAIGCNRGLDTKEAVRQAVIDHLSSRSNLNVASMQVDVTSVSFRGAEADATVAFRPKGSAAGGSMTMSYKLEKKDSRWVVKGKSDAGGMPHGAMSGGATGEMPAGHPPVTGKEPPGATK